MKKIILTLALTLVLASCGGGDGGTVDTEKSGSSCPYKTEDFVNCDGSGTSADFAWVCTYEGGNIFLYVCSDNEGFSSAVGAFTWAQNGCDVTATYGSYTSSLTDISVTATTASFTEKRSDETYHFTCTADSASSGASGDTNDSSTQEPSVDDIAEGTGTAMTAKDPTEIENLVREVVFEIADRWMTSAEENLSIDQKSAQTTACTTGAYGYFIGTPMVEDDGKGIITVTNGVDGGFKISRTASSFNQETSLLGNFAEYQNSKVYLTDKSITVSGDVEFVNGFNATGDIDAACADLANGTSYLTGMTMAKGISGGYSISGDIAGALTFGVSMEEAYNSPTQVIPTTFAYDGSATFKSGGVTSTCALSATSRPNTYDDISIICQ